MSEPVLPPGLFGSSTGHILGARVLKRSSSSPWIRSFLNWAGGKYSALKHLKLCFPKGCHRLVEPFVGSGVVFGNFPDHEAFLLNDSNPDLVRVWQYLAENPEDFIKRCATHFAGKIDRDSYESARERFNASVDPLERASIFVFLLRQCFNGLCRYSAGKFNVPFRGEPAPFPEEQMRRFAFLLQRRSVEIRCGDFEEIIDQTGEGDLVYCDPPYFPRDGDAGFTAYDGRKFVLDDHQRLVRAVERAAKRGATLFISNFDLPESRKLYSGATEVKTFGIRRSISGLSKGRMEVPEMLAMYRTTPPRSYPSTPKGDSMQPPLQAEQVLALLAGLPTLPKPTSSRSCLILDLPDTESEIRFLNKGDFSADPDLATRFSPSEAENVRQSLLCQGNLPERLFIVRLGKTLQIVQPKLAKSTSAAPKEPSPPLPPPAKAQPKLPEPSETVSGPVAEPAHPLAALAEQSLTALSSAEVVPGPPQLPSAPAEATPQLKAGAPLHQEPSPKPAQTATPAESDLFRTGSSQFSALDPSFAEALGRAFGRGLVNGIYDALFQRNGGKS